MQRPDDVGVERSAERTVLVGDDGAAGPACLIGERPGEASHARVADRPRAEARRQDRPAGVGEDRVEDLRQQRRVVVDGAGPVDRVGHAAEFGHDGFDALARLRPQSLRELLETLNPDSASRVKTFLTKSLLTVLARDDTATTINGILSTQIERFLVAPIGRLGDHMPAGAIEKASAALTEKITAAARERLPAAIAEFDVGGLVRKKVSEYPIEKLEALVLSVAQHHLKTIELFGALIGFWIGVGQAIYFWFTYVPKR